MHRCLQTALTEMNSTQCPKCNSKNTCPIFWGYPSEKQLKEAKQQKMFLGGYIISDNDPAMYCNDCQNKWGRREDYE